MQELREYLDSPGSERSTADDLYLLVVEFIAQVSQGFLGLLVMAQVYTAFDGAVYDQVDFIKRYEEITEYNGFFFHNIRQFQ